MIDKKKEILSIWDKNTNKAHNHGALTLSQIGIKKNNDSQRSPQPRGFSVIPVLDKVSPSTAKDCHPPTRDSESHHAHIPDATLLA